MDGLLINSEDLYSLCTNIVLQEHGKPDLPWSIKAQLQGRPGPEATRIFQEWAQLPMDDPAYRARIAALQAEHFPSCEPLPGVPELLRNLSRTSTPKVHMALATSSHKVNFALKTQKLEELFSVFAKDRRVLGDDERIPKGRGKPAPDIYLLALETINEGIRRQNQSDGMKQEQEIRPDECLVFEDSVPGVESGRRAGMQVVWCPHSGLLQEYRGREKEVLAGLTGQYQEVGEERTESEKKNEAFGKVVATGQRLKGAPGNIDDGSGRLLESLADFPYVEYGIQI
ncbi:HAD-like protein [Viridothelium virens]|uniref:HAD-like protein n=1 Tax=Viridothelium virens TaxID=1048519 RepID=A0A6A6HPX7_VIRVR|nr:HAD-like protein [Viridothelium virens]